MQRFFPLCSHSLNLGSTPHPLKAVVCVSFGCLLFFPWYLVVLSLIVGNNDPFATTNCWCYSFIGRKPTAFFSFVME